MSTNPPDGITGGFAPAPLRESPPEQTDFFSSDTFLRVLTAQMANQNPLEPMSDTDFIAQMAQFGQIEHTVRMSEALEAMALSSRLSEGSALIGKTVTYAEGGDGAARSGAVERLVVSGDGDARLVVDGAEVELDWVSEVSG